MTELSPKKRARVVEIDHRGLKQQDIAIKLGISQGTASKMLNHIKNNDFEGDLRLNTRSGRPLKISPKTDQRIRHLVQNNPTISSTDIVFQLRHHLSKKLGLKAYKPAKKPLLSSKNIRDCLNFCKKYKDWTPQQWMEVMFSDEAKIVQFS